MSIEMAVVFGRVGAATGLSPATALLLLPRLAAGTLLSADLGFRASRRAALAELRIAPGALAMGVRDRLAFWCGREGGWAGALGSMRPHVARELQDELRACDAAVRGVVEAEWEDAVGRVLAFAGVAVPSRPSRPVLAIQVAGPAWESFTYDPARRLLFVPSPLSPPAGDEFTLQLERAGAARIVSRGTVRVVATRSRHQEAPGAPAGFAVRLPEHDDAGHFLLGAHAPEPAATSSGRRAPRHRVLGAVSTEREQGTGAGAGAPGPAGEAAPIAREYVENLSSGGAFVRTSKPHRVGDAVVVGLRLPGGHVVRLPSTVVHARPDGVGLSFEADAGTDAALAGTLAAMPGRRRRALVVDDDAFARRMFTDALEQRGFEVMTACDSESALRSIVDELLSLDVVVTDVCMPGPSGEELVRTIRSAGGETDLAIVVVGASVDDALCRRMLEAGADAVLSKGRGIAATVDAVEGALAARRRRLPALDDAADPPVRGDAADAAGGTP